MLQQVVHAVSIMTQMGSDIAAFCYTVCRCLQTLNVTDRQPTSVNRIRVVKGLHEGFEIRLRETGGYA